MKRLSMVFTVMAGGLCLCVYPALGQRGGGRGAQPPNTGMPPQAHGAGDQGAPASGRRATPPEERMGQAARGGQRVQVATQLERNPNLSTRLTPLLPQGMLLQDAATGFKNQGQFIAALHVSQNLGIPFADLKTRMTGENPVSLGKAVQELRPEMRPEQVQTTVKQAETQAKEDVREARRVEAAKP